MKKFLRTFILTRRLFPYSCNECGEDLIRLRLKDLSPEIQTLHIQAGTVDDLENFCYKCLYCFDGLEAVMII
ncbi:hypothetical protein MYX06_04680 [Patescibacteria group bacterium AH-259-L05]|nr:hypothetical protein [Patescibacteria group bacterium AH-259-L05]